MNLDIDAKRIVTSRLFAAHPYGLTHDKARAFKLWLDRHDHVIDSVVEDALASLTTGVGVFGKAMALAETQPGVVANMDLAAWLQECGWDVEQDGVDLAALRKTPPSGAPHDALDTALTEHKKAVMFALLNAMPAEGRLDYVENLGEALALAYGDTATDGNTLRAEASDVPGYRGDDKYVDVDIEPTLNTLDEMATNGSVILVDEDTSDAWLAFAGDLLRKGQDSTARKHLPDATATVRPVIVSDKDGIVGTARPTAQYAADYYRFPDTKAPRGKLTQKHLEQVAREYVVWPVLFAVKDDARTNGAAYDKALRARANARKKLTKAEEAAATAKAVNEQRAAATANNTALVPHLPVAFNRHAYPVACSPDRLPVDSGAGGDPWRSLQHDERSRPFWRSS